MADTVKNKKDIATSLGEYIYDHKGEEVVVIDVREDNSWTDYMIITTINSIGHLRGLVRQIKEMLAGMDINILRGHKQISDDGWELIDCGDYVIHLMNREKREFYNLDKLWFSGKIIYHSSKSS